MYQKKRDNKVSIKFARELECLKKNVIEVLELMLTKNQGMNLLVHRRADKTRDELANWETTNRIGYTSLSP